MVKTAEDKKSKMKKGGCEEKTKRIYHLKGNCVSWMKGVVGKWGRVQATK